MKIISLDITNTRKIKAFHIKLDGNNLHIAGNVAEGKTTVISALWDILDKRGDVITHGKNKSSVRIALSDGSKTIIAERNTTPKTSTIKLYDEAEPKKKISLKDFKQMISDLSVNPHKIREMKPTEQVQVLLSAAKVSIDLEKVDKDIADLEVKRLAAYRDTQTLNPGPEPERVEKVSISELLEEKAEAEDRNQANDAKRKKLEGLREKHKELVSKCARLDLEYKQAMEELDSINNSINKGTEVVGSLVDEDVDAILHEIESAEATNEKAALYAKWSEGHEKYTEAKEEHEKHEADIKTKREEKKNALELAKWPLEGLSIEDGTIMYQGCLMENLGESEQMLVCSALAIQDIKAHPLKVVRLDGIESMSKEHFGQLVKLFNDEDIQVLSTRVARGDTEPGEITIEAGEYKDEDWGLGKFREEESVGRAEDAPEDDEWEV